MELDDAEPIDERRRCVRLDGSVRPRVDDRVGLDDRIGVERRGILPESAR